MMNRLPEFERPPLVETATSVQFNELPKLTNALIAVFWDRHLRTEYPQAEETHPIEHQFERFTEQPGERPRFPRMKLVPFPPSRLQMTTADGHRMVQVQNGRLVLNWRRLSGGVYPRWSTTFPLLQRAMGQLRQFLSAEGIGELEPNQWEVVYVNHLPRGIEWSKPHDWPALLPGLFGHMVSLPNLGTESASAGLRLEIQPRAGRLHVDANYGISGSPEEGVEVLSLQFTARGAVDLGNTDGYTNGLNLGRSVIVQTFAAITGSEAHQRWGRRQ